MTWTWHQLVCMRRTRSSEQMFLYLPLQMGTFSTLLEWLSSKAFSCIHSSNWSSVDSSHMTWTWQNQKRLLELKHQWLMTSLVLKGTVHPKSKIHMWHALLKSVTRSNSSFLDKRGFMSTSQFLVILMFYLIRIRNTLLIPRGKFFKGPFL